MIRQHKQEPIRLLSLSPITRKLIFLLYNEK